MDLVSTSGLAAHLPQWDGRFSWSLEAQHVTVDWTRVTFVELGRPGDPSQPHTQVQQSPPESGRDEYGPASASSTSRHAGSDAIVLPVGGPTFRHATGTGTATLHAATPSWKSGLDANRTEFPDPGPFSVAYQPPPASIQVTAADGTLHLRGTLSLVVWEADVVLRSGDESHVYASGNWTEPLGPPSGDPSGHLRQRHHQILHIRAVDAILDLHLDGRPATWVAHRVQGTGDLHASFAQAQGLIEYGDLAVPIHAPTYEFHGPARIEAWNGTGPDGGPTARIWAPPDAWDLAGPAAGDPGRPGGPAIPWPAGAGWWNAGILLALGAAALTGVLANRWRRPVTPDAVEWALVRGKPRRARRLARRLVQQHPTMPVAVFLYAASLLASSHHRQILDDVAPRIGHLPPKERPPVAYILAVAAARCGRDGALAKWAGIAAQSPEMLTRMQEEGILDGLPDATPLEGYA